MYNIYVNYDKDKEMTYIGVTKLSQKELIAEQKQKGYDQFVEILESYDDYNTAQVRKNYLVDFYRPKYMKKGKKKDGGRKRNSSSSR